MLSEVEGKEFERLVSDLGQMGFRQSSELSNYIVRNKLGHRYQHISGYLRMEMEGREWNFNGGFPPHIYARLCERLGLGNKRTRARAVAFEAYADRCQTHQNCAGGDFHGFSLVF